MITRMIALDAFRGLTIALMILVNSPGYHVAYPYLLHSTWNGCSLADLVFPFFIVVVGISCAFTLTKAQIQGIPRKQICINIIKRSLYLFVMGLLLNMLPNHFDLSSLRILGVLQRIAICYLLSALLFLVATVRVQIIITTVLLFGYWSLLSLFSAAYPLSLENNLIGFIDQLILSPKHLYTNTFDPEGLLSTVPAVASVLLGTIMGHYLISARTKQQQFQRLLSAGIVVSSAGWVWSFIDPFNKSIWSSSYVLWTSGLSFLCFAGCFLLIEIKKWQAWSKPLVLFGRNALLVYMLHVLFLKIQAIILIHPDNGTTINLRLYLTDVLFGYLSPQNASLCYAVSYTLFWLLVLRYNVTLHGLVSDNK